MRRRLFPSLAGVTGLAVVLGAGTIAGGGLVAAQQTGGQTGQPTGGVATAAQAQTEPGILIQGVVPGSPAAAAGVARGDILLKVNDQAVNTLRDLANALKDRQAGDQVTLTVQHGDAQRTLMATVSGADGPPFLGLIPCAGPHAGGLVIRAAPGALIQQVEADSPAAQAGLQAGDWIVSVNGQKLEANRTLADAIGAQKPGDTVTLEVTRPGQQSRQVTVQLGQHPDDAAKAYLGVRTIGLPRMDQMEGAPFALPALPGLPEEFFAQGGAEVQQGAVIRRVTDQSPAATAGLQAGDTITAIDGQPVDSPRALADAVTGRRPGETLRLTVRRPGQTDTREVEVTLGEHPEKPGTGYLGAEVGAFFLRRSQDAPAGDPAAHASDQIIPAPTFDLEIDPEAGGGRDRIELRILGGPGGSNAPGSVGSPGAGAEPLRLDPAV